MHIYVPGSSAGAQEKGKSRGRAGKEREEPCRVKRGESREEDHGSIWDTSRLETCHLDTDDSGQVMVDYGRDVAGAKATVGGGPRALALSNACIWILFQ